MKKILLTATLLILSIATVPVFAELVLLYEMEQTPAEGSEITDSTSNTAGVVADMPGWPLPYKDSGAAAHTGYSWNFSNSPRSIVVDGIPEVTDALGDIAVSDGFTMAFWVNLLFDKDAGHTNLRVAGFSNVFDLNMGYAGTIGVINCLVGSPVNDTQVNILTPATNGGVLDGNWHHVAFTYDFTSSVGNAKLYIDGVYSGLSASKAVNESFAAGTTTDIFIGARAGGSAAFPGSIDDFALFNHALSAADVSRLYQGGANIFVTPCAGDGDFNNNCKVDFKDLAILCENWMDSAIGIKGDTDASDSVDEVDLAKTAANWLKIVHDAPELDAGRSKTLMLASGQSQVTHTMSAWATDDGLPNPSVEVLWDVIEDPTYSVVTFDDPTALSPMVTITQPGSYTLRMTAFDGEHESSDAAIIHVFDEVASGLETANFPAPPAPYEHPRVLFNKSQIPALKNYYANTTSGQEAYKTLKGNSVMLRDGYFYWDNSADYATTLDGDARVANVGYWDWSDEYNKLVSGDSSVIDEFAAGMGPLGKIANLISMEAFYCMLNDDVAGMQDVAAAITTWATRINPTIQPEDDWQWGDQELCRIFDKVGREFLGLCYDIVYDHMTPAQRDIVRDTISKATTGKTGVGMDMEGTEVAGLWGNWVPFHSNALVLLSLCIEGETGYDPGVYDRYVAAYSDYMTYQIHPAGSTQEPLGKSLVGAVPLVALAKRGEMLIGHPHYKAFLEDFMVNDYQPYGYGFIALGDLGTEYSQGGSMLHDAMVGKFAYPNNAAVDHVFRNAVSDDYHYSDFHGGLYEILFMDDFDMSAWNQPWDMTVLGKDPYYYDRDRGLVISRSDWTQECLYLYFTCRQDVRSYGHFGNQRNSFILSALGRNWVPYNEGRDLPDAMSMVIVDGQGSTAAIGQMVDFQTDDVSTFSTGDATYAYNWHWRNGAYLAELHKFTDYSYNDHYENWNNISLYELYGLIKGQYTPMSYAYRTAGLVRGDRPYVLIVDDIQKDDAVHEYKWLMRISDDLVDGIEINGTEAILSDPDSDKRLMVKVLGYEGSPSLAVEEFIAGPGDTSRRYTVYSLVVTTNAVTPEFKIMIYPYMAGDPLPIATWNGDDLNLRINGQEDDITFTSVGEYTQVTVDRGDPIAWVSAEAGPDQTITLPATAKLDGTAQGGNLPAAIDVEWSVAYKPAGATVTFSPSAFVDDPEVSFSDPNDTYVLEYTVSSGAYSQTDSMTVAVLPEEPYGSAPILIYGMNQTPVTGTDEIIDTTGNTSATLLNAAVLPTVIDDPHGSADPNNAWDFTNSDSYISVTRDSVTESIGNVNTTDGMTISFWVKFEFDKDAGHTNYRVAGLWETFDLNMGYAGDIGVISFILGNGVSVPRFSLPTSYETGGVLDGNWHHVAMTIDYGSSTDNFKIFEDGKLTKVASQSVTSSFTTLTKNVIIGARLNGSYFFPGALDEFAIYDRALDDGGAAVGESATSEVQRLYEHGPASFLW